MEQLTREYFEKGMSNFMDKLEKFATKDDLVKLEEKMATKDDLKSQTIELKQYVAESFETQQIWMDERFKEQIVNYDVRERVGRLEKEVVKLKLAH